VAATPIRRIVPDAAARTSRRDERYWVDSLKLATKLLAFREQLPDGQRAILDDIMLRAQTTTSAPLAEVAGYQLESAPGAASPPTKREQQIAVLEGYFAQVG
jgi:hypothetical protein